MAGYFASIARQARLAARVPLKDVASSLRMSVAYVSEVERGNRAAPNAERAAAWARAVRADEEAFIAAAAQDRESLELPIEEGIPHFRREAAFAFARAYDGLTEEQAKKVMKLLRGQE